MNIQISNFGLLLLNWSLRRQKFQDNPIPLQVWTVNHIDTWKRDAVAYKTPLG